MGSIVEKLKNILTVKGKSQKRFEIAPDVPLAEFPEEIEKNAKGKFENEILNTEW